MSSKLSETLSRIQRSLIAPKGQFNSFGKYKYRSCEDILQAIKPLLPEGVYVTITDDVHVAADRVYIKSTATITDYGSAISSSGFAREAPAKKGMDESQITGAASSYARKYALNGLFLIDDAKDADSRNPQGEVIAAAAIDAKKEVADWFINYAECVRACWDEISAYKEAIANDDLASAINAWMDIAESDQILIYKLSPTKGGVLTTKERDAMKSNEWAAARNELLK